VKGGQAIVLGASSQIGLFAVPRLAARGLTVWAVSRRPRPEWYPVLDGVRWVTPADARARNGPDPRFLISAGPLALAVDWLRGRSGVTRAVGVSTSSVVSKAESPSVAERREMAAIVAGEDQMKMECDRQGTAWCLLRPTLVYGCGMDRNVSLLARFIERWGILPLSREAHGMRQPVHADDVAKAAVAALFTPASDGLSTPVCGGSTLAYRQMVERIFEALGRPCRILELPAGLLAAIAFLAVIAGQGRVLRPQMVRRLALDLIFDDGPARAALGHAPRRFRPTRDDFAAPDGAVITRLAKPAPGATCG